MDPQPSETPSDDTTPAELPADYMELPTGTRLKIVKDLMQRGEQPETLFGRMTATFSGGDPGVVSALTTVVDVETDATIVKMALHGLTRTGSDAAIPGLLRGLDADKPGSRWEAIHGLGQLQARVAVPGLIALLGVSRSRVKAGRALVEIGDERALEPLQEAAGQGSFMSRGKLRRHAEELELRLAGQAS